MTEPKCRSMHPDDWERVPIARGRYSNRAFGITGYRQADGQAGSTLHPICVVEDRLLEKHKALQEAYAGVHISRKHVKMPYWDRHEPRLPDNYRFVQVPERLTTTSVTVVLVSRDQIRDAEMGFYFDGRMLPSLRERMRGAAFRGVAGNLGYYVTESLIEGERAWSHNARYPEFPLSIIHSYIGFYLFRDRETGEVFSSFQGAHPAAVGIRKDRTVEIIPRLEVEGYDVTLWGREISVNGINDPGSVDKVMLFTPGLRTAEVDRREGDWETYAPEIPLPDRVNVFVANEGNGQVPVDRVVKVWEGRAPLPSFGAVLSFERGYFEKLFANVGAFGCLDRRVKVEPRGKTDFDGYVQIMGGFVPVVVEGDHIYRVETVDEIRERLRRYGNATSPIAQCGRETNNFAPRVREPAGILLQTEDRIGWVLFDGRHELSIGASVVDVAKILGMLEDDGVFGGAVASAILIDGGSAMKAYAIQSDGATTTLDLLNRVAAGSRNGPGIDPDGRNLYTLLKLSL